MRVARLLVYMCPPTSMCTGALDLVSCAGVGMPWLLKGDTGDRVIMGLDMLERLSCRDTKQHNVTLEMRKTDSLVFFVPGAGCADVNARLYSYKAVQKILSFPAFVFQRVKIFTSV